MTKTINKMKHEFKPFLPFDKVLVKDGAVWICALFSHIANGYYICGGRSFKYCLPYEGNEHLVGTTDDPVKPKLKVVRGNAKRGNDVIKLLEGIGGINKSNCKGKNDAAFYYISKRGVICCTDDNSMFFNGFELEILELPEPKRWRAETYGNYWFIAEEDFDVLECRDTNTIIDISRYECGNYFKTKEEAEEMADKIKELFRHYKP